MAAARGVPLTCSWYYRRLETLDIAGQFAVDLAALRAASIGHVRRAVWLMRVNPWADAGVACVAQWTRVADAVDALPDDAFELPTRVAWVAGQLTLSRTSRCARASLHDGLQSRRPTVQRRALRPYLLSLGAAASSIDELARSLAAGQTPTRIAGIGAKRGRLVARRRLVDGSRAGDPYPVGAACGSTISW